MSAKKSKAPASKKKTGGKVGPQLTTYERKILPNIEQIREAVNGGASQRQIMEQLDISIAAFYRARRAHPELDAIFTKPDYAPLIKDLKSALVKKALGFREKEIKTVAVFSKTEPNKVVAKNVETFDRYYPPDVAAINLALKNFDAPNWSNDPADLAIKREQLELAKAAAEREAARDSVDQNQPKALEVHIIDGEEGEVTA